MYCVKLRGQIYISFIFYNHILNVVQGAQNHSCSHHTIIHELTLEPADSDALLR